MSTVIAKNVQIGTSGTATDNFTFYQPSTPDGTVRLGNGNSGSVTDVARFTSAGGFSFNSGYGSVATAYGCRAWVNFNGTGTVAIRASGNVTSITDNGTGDYTVNFTTAMPDANYAVSASAFRTTDETIVARYSVAPTTSAVRLLSFTRSAGSVVDPDYFNVAIFR